MSTQAIITDHYVPTREPKQVTIALSTTGKNLGVAEGGSTIQSNFGFDVWCSADWYYGDVDGQARLVPANSGFNIPSSDLLGWWAKSASGTPNLIITRVLRVQREP